MASGKVSRSLWIVGWFAGVLIFNIASHWSQNVDKNGLFIFLEALGRLTTPAELLLSAVVVYCILSSGARQKANDGDVRTTKRKTALHTAYILVGTLVGVMVIGFVAASWHGGDAAKGQQASVNAGALDNYALLSKSSSELGNEDDGLSPDTKKRMREGLTLQLAGGLQKQNNPVRVDVTGADHDILVFELPSMNDEMAEELIQEFKQANDANFWNAARLMNYSQVVFSGDSYKKVVSRAEFLSYGKDYDKYKEAFLKAAAGLQAGAQGEISKSTTSAKPFAMLPTLAHLKAQMKEENPGMSPREFKHMRAATGLSHIWELHKDSLKPVSALYLADGTVCYQYFFVTDGKRNIEYGVLTTDGLLYVNALGTAPWKQLCEGEKGEEMVGAAAH
jgi:hypothetical protein